MKAVHRPFKRNSDTELQSFVTRYERELQAGTSSHADIVALVDAEREIMYREAKQLRRTIDEERRARTMSSASGGGWLAVGAGLTGTAGTGSTGGAAAVACAAGAGVERKG